MSNFSCDALAASATVYGIMIGPLEFSNTSRGKKEECGIALFTLLLRCVQLLAQEHLYKILAPPPTRGNSNRNPKNKEQPEAEVADRPHKPEEGEAVKPKAKGAAKTKSKPVKRQKQN